jgi:FkbM family methyltransferase
VTVDPRFELVRLIAWGRRTFGLRIGQSLFNRVLYPPALRQRHPKQVTINYDGEFTLHLATQSWIEWCLFLDGYFEYPIHQLLTRLVSPGAVVFDVGANIGAHTLTLSRLVGAQGRVIAIEPCPPVLNKLHKNLNDNQVRNVTVLPIGASNQSGTAQLFWRDNDTNEGQATFWPNEATNVQYEVGTATLDELVREQQLPTVNLIKIDVQGAEFQVLQGAQQTLHTFKPALIFEYDWNWESSAITFVDVQAFLVQFGYTLHSISRSGHPLPLKPNPVGEILALAAP